tara:strand:+ start:1290 stop:1964 length:675 start_codon:yes stop_codon:yes gene_type:complete
MSGSDNELSWKRKYIATPLKWCIEKTGKTFVTAFAILIVIAIIDYCILLVFLSDEFAEDISHVDIEIDEGDDNSLIIQEAIDEYPRIYASSDDFSYGDDLNITAYSFDKDEDVFRACDQYGDDKYENDTVMNVCYSGSDFPGYILLGVIESSSVDFVTIQNNNTFEIKICEGQQLYFHDGVIEQAVTGILNSLKFYMILGLGLVIIIITLGKYIDWDNSSDDED